MRITFAVVSAALGIILGACSEAPRADLVLTGGRIYTGDSHLGTVEALAVSDGTIVAVGRDAEIERRVGPNTRVIELAGRFALPGFNDAHVHLAGAGQQLLSIDAAGTRSLAELQARLAARLKDFPPGAWITGRGWDQSLWPEAQTPTRDDLDAVSGDHPVLLKRVDGHSAVANSAALTIAGITAATPDPAGGTIVRDAAGRPTGWLKDKAVDLVARHIPAPTMEQLKRGLELAIADTLAHGVTSVQDDSVRSFGWAAFEALAALKQEGKLRLRVSEWLPLDAPLDQLEAWRAQGGTDDPWLKTGALKAIGDGSGGSLTAAMLAPFANAPGNTGLLLIEPDRLNELVANRAAAGFQIAVHAIGDRANRVALDAFEATARTTGKTDARHRIEHAQFIDDADLARFAKLGVIASMQPSHLLSDLRWAPAILGPAREHEGYRWHSLLQSGATLAFGTDYPVEGINPMRGLYAAITREFEAGGPIGGWQPQERLSIEQAIRAYTLGAAWAEFEEARKGTLAPGKFADIVVLSNDLLNASPQEILNATVEITIVGGQIVYQKQ